MYATVYKESERMLAVANTYSFSNWLEIEMGKREMSQAELARKAGVTRAAINGILSGRRGPGTDLCNAIAKALDLPPEMVFQKAGLLQPQPEMDETTQRMKHIFDQLSEEDQETLIGMAQFFAEKRQFKARTRKRPAEG